MPVAKTSKMASRGVDRDQWYGRIKAMMRLHDREFCIADLAHKLNAEKSTISARLNEMCKFGMIHYAGVKRSQTTKVLAKHYRLTIQETLF